MIQLKPIRVPSGLVTTRQVFDCFGGLVSDAADLPSRHKVPLGTTVIAFPLRHLPSSAGLGGHFVHLSPTRT